MKGRRYKRSGWFGESHRHYLASKGIKTKRRYFSFGKDTQIPTIETPARFKSNVRVVKELMSPQEAESLLSQAIGGDIPGQKRFRRRQTQKRVQEHREGQELRPFVVYYKKQDDGSWKPDSYENDAVLFAALELGKEEIPVVKTYKRPFKSTGLMQGEFEFSDREKELSKKQEEAIYKAGGLTTRQTGNVVDIVPNEPWKLTEEERELLKDENIREATVIDNIPDEFMAEKTPREKLQQVAYREPQDIEGAGNVINTVSNIGTKIIQITTARPIEFGIRTAKGEKRER